jgi:hypothetical protein
VACGRLIAGVCVAIALGACRSANPFFQPDGGAAPVSDGARSEGGSPSDGPARAEVAPADTNLHGDVEVDVGQPDIRGAGAPGAACTAGTTCASGFCADGICCNSACGDLCWACNLAHALGTCVPVPTDDDPRGDCSAEAPATCGLTGGCDGRGACRRHPIGTECQARSCSAGTETTAGQCNGTGACLAGTSSACTTSACTGDRCATGCSGTAPCENGFSCVAGQCAPAGAALYWRFDELSGTAAMDSSGNGFHGVYLGDPTPPAPSTDLPPTSFTNVRSRLFGATGQPEVELASVKASLTPANNVTFAVWFRTRTVAPDGSDLINLGTDLFLRLKPDRIEFVKRRSTESGMIYAIAAVNDVVTHVDGAWHHLAAVASSTGMRLYFDGTLRANDISTEPILHTTPTLWVGRQGDSTTHDFTGNIDEVRIYPRALSAPQITTLSTGAP